MNEYKLIITGRNMKLLVEFEQELKIYSDILKYLQYSKIVHFAFKNDPQVNVSEIVLVNYRKNSFLTLID